MDFSFPLVYDFLEDPTDGVSPGFHRYVRGLQKVVDSTDLFQQHFPVLRLVRLRGSLLQRFQFFLKPVPFFFQPFLVPLKFLQGIDPAFVGLPDPSSFVSRRSRESWSTVSRLLVSGSCFRV